MKLFQSKTALSFLGLLILLCHSCDTTKSAGGGAIDTARPPQAVKERIEAKLPEAKQPETKQIDTKPEAPAGQSNIVAKIGEYVIAKEELQARLMMELRPRYGEYSKQDELVDAKTVLAKMIAEKAMIIEARKLNYLEDETIQASLKRFNRKKLATLLLENHLRGKITVAESEIAEKMKTDPKLNRARAKTMVERAKANLLLGQYYSQICEKLHLQKSSANFPEAARIHQRLLLRPKEPRRMKLIRISQVKNELTPEEKNIVLATYDTGKVTLKDWFDTLCELSPPSRPRDLHTVAGVERLLNRALRIPIFVSEAESLGLDKDENLLKQTKEREDIHLFGKANREKVKDLPEPNELEIMAYFEKNKEAFGTQKTLRIDQIWCQDFKTAQKVKDELDSGKDFEAARKEYSLQKKAYAFNASPPSEGMFFQDLWNGEPNEIVGPVKGFYSDGVKWRIVKILEKTPGQLKEYSSDMKQHIQMRMLEEQRNTILENYRKELLEKYSYEIYGERIRDIDPLNIP
ncbi:MAG: peptidylprolyl isomerase [Planctomycetota bacterium]|jgi:hypothetical protein